MTEPILKIEGLVKNFGGLIATNNLHMDIRPNEIHAVIGPNGAGKTTLVAQLSGMLKPDAGRIIFLGQDISAEPTAARSHLGLARSFQITSFFPNFTALENVAMSIQSHNGHSFRFWKRASTDPERIEPARTVLNEVGLGDRANVKASSLAHGEQRQLEIAMALATKPKLLLLDEPLAGMGAEESEHMREFLASLKNRFSMLLIEHDMDTVFSIADRVTVLVYGAAIATGTPDEIRGNEEVRTAYLGDDDEFSHA